MKNRNEKYKYQMEKKWQDHNIMDRIQAHLLAREY